MTDLLQNSVGKSFGMRRASHGAGGSAVRQKIFLDVVAVGLEQHVSAAQLADLLRGPLDHAVALAALGVFDLAAGSDLEALFGARFGLQLGHLALLCPASGTAPGGDADRQMLARALKYLIFLYEQRSDGRRHGSP